jgi:RES domain-containing protein
MQVYRITLKKWSTSLRGSGFPGRWNSEGKYVVYTSGSRALASLENIVHRSGEGLNSVFKVMVINIPDDLTITEIKIEDLKESWFAYDHYNYCQKIGDQWFEACETPILKVPSSIVKQESNFLLNQSHPQFKRISILSVEDFDFDPRLK